MAVVQGGCVKNTDRKVGHCVLLLAIALRSLHGIYIRFHSKYSAFFVLLDVKIGQTVNLACESVTTDSQWHKTIDCRLDGCRERYSLPSAARKVVRFRRKEESMNEFQYRHTARAMKMSRIESSTKIISTSSAVLKTASVAGMFEMG
jgi:hypothetical protein